MMDGDSQREAMPISRWRTVLDSVKSPFGSVIVVIVTALAAALAVSFVGWWQWDWFSEGESNSTTVRNFGIIAAIPTSIILAGWRNLVAHRQADTAHTQAVTAQLRAEAERENDLNTHYSRGAEMLSGQTPMGQIGGISALRALVLERPSHNYEKTLRLLLAYVNNIGSRVDDAEALEAGSEGCDAADARDCPYSVEPEVLEAIEAISDCHQAALEIAEGELRRPSLEYIDLHGGNFYRSALSHLNLGSVSLVHANLFGAQLIDSILVGARLVGACLIRAKLMNAFMWYANLEGAELHHADLRLARLSEANLTEVTLIDANLQGAELHQTNLSGTRFHQGDLNAASPQAVKGLTQEQLDQAIADPDNPPLLDGFVLDAVSDEPLVWNYA